MFEVNNVQENGEKGSFSSRTAYLRSVWVLISHLPITILVMFICIVNYISDLVWPLGAIQVYSCQRIRHDLQKPVGKKTFDLL